MRPERLVKRGIPYTHIFKTFFDLLVSSSSLPGELDKFTNRQQPTISTISYFTKMNFNTTISMKHVSFIDVQISLPCLPIMILAISQKAEDRRGAKSWVQKEEGAGLIRKLKVPRKNCFLFRIRSFHCPSIFFLVQCLQPTKYYLRTVHFVEKEILTQNN